MDRRVPERLNALVRQLRQPVSLLTEGGVDALTGEAGQDMPDTGLLPLRTVVLQDGRALLLSEAWPDAVWATPASDDGAGDLLAALDALLMQCLTAQPEKPDLMAAYRAILLDQLDEWELEETLATQDIPRVCPRCVLMMQTDVGWRSDAAETVRPVLPLEQGDVLVPFDRHSAALLKDMTALGERSELCEYAEAIADTVMSEAGCSITIGIGGCAADVIGLPASCAEARLALKLGRVYREKQSVYDYQRMLMSRFMSELPRTLAASYHHLLFNAETARLFSDEMLETVTTFFDKDLNLSDTARQLYIHRNTLTYRLDKVAKATGLDLRRFEDAVTFKLLLEMGKRAAETGRAEPGDPVEPIDATEGRPL